jgi:hypothetical protein
MPPMAEFIVNPRRGARAPARCRAAVVFARGRFDADTEDIGSRGCQVVAPKPISRGEPVHLLIINQKVTEPLQATGQVAWASAQAPWRIGIAFDEGSLEQTAGWFERLVAAHPALAGYRRVPERLALDQTVYLGSPPRFLVDFTADEGVVLRAIASGARIDELRARLRDRWSAGQRALFSLLARQAVTLQRGQAVHPDCWKKILTDLEASLAVESLGKGGVAAPLERAAATTELGFAPPAPMQGYDPAQAYDPTHVIELEEDDGPPLEIGFSTDESPASRNAPYGPGVPRDRSGAGVGWRRPPKRSADAQVALDRGLTEIAAGDVNAGITFLRIALTLAPGDPEIARQLGKVAFGGRRPGER